MPSWYVYILKSINRDFVYIGSTKSIKRRYNEHNDGLVQSTKHYRPFELEIYIAVKSEKKAKELEHYFKTGSGKAVLVKRFISE